MKTTKKQDKKIGGGLNFDLSQPKWTFIFIAIALIFSVCARLYWVAWASGDANFFYNGELMINTNDGYAFAEGARDMLAGFHQENDLSLYGSSLSTLTCLIVRFLGVQMETAMLYMSVLFGSLIVIPVILISAEYKMQSAALVAALIASVANSYYNRTMAGYYDTDMLTIVLPMFIVWGLVRFVKRNEARDIVIAPISILAYTWWYPSSSFSLIAACVGLFFLYTIAFERKNRLAYAQLILLLIAMSGADFWLKILLILAFYLFCLKRSELLNLKILASLLAAAVAIFAAYGGLNPIIFQLKFYLFRSVADSGGISFSYFNVNQTIQESSVVDWEMFCRRISGHAATFGLSLAGVLLLCLKQRSFLLSFGMLGLGFLAAFGGLRFTIYAVPVMAIGFGYFLCFATQSLNLKGISREVLTAIAALIALFPIGMHIYNYKATPVFSNKEVAVLDKLKEAASREDYALAWWDYGYPIRYYADVKTLIDGGKHLGADNYAVSFALGEDQISSANMARLEVEYTERKFREKFGSNLVQMLSDRGINDVDDFLRSLQSKNFMPPSKTREIYYYLPERMLYIFPTIMQFSKIDLKNGKGKNGGLFYVARPTSANDSGIGLSGGFTLSNDAKTLFYNDTSVEINSYVQTQYKDGKLVVSELKFEPRSKIYVIFMSDYGRFLILDEDVFKSAYIQLFALERYDSELFEPIVLEKAAKIYRLKR